MDIAFAINVHPYSLGVAPDVKGFLSLPVGLSIKIMHVTNPLKHAAGVPNQRNNYVLPEGTEHSMPKFVDKLVPMLAEPYSLVYR